MEDNRSILLKLTKDELKALKAILWTNPCSSGCIYEEMEESPLDCLDCKFPKSIHSINEKLDHY